MRLSVERLTDHLLRGGDREIGELPAQFSNGRVALELDFRARASEHRFLLLLRGGAALGLEASRNLLRLKDQFLAVVPCLIELCLDSLLILRCLPLNILGGLQAGGDSPPPFVEILHDRPKQKGAEQQEEDREVDDERHESWEIDPESRDCLIHVPLGPF